MQEEYLLSDNSSFKSTATRQTNHNKLKQTMTGETGVP